MFKSANYSQVLCPGSTSSGWSRGPAILVYEYVSNLGCVHLSCVQKCKLLASSLPWTSAPAGARRSRAKLSLPAYTSERSSGNISPNKLDFVPVSQGKTESYVMIIGKSLHGAKGDWVPNVIEETIFTPGPAGNLTRTTCTTMEHSTASL